MRDLLLSAVDLALPRTCGGCGEVGTLLCVRCAVALDGAPRPVVPCPPPDGWPAAWAGGAYVGPAAAVLRAYKDADRRDLRTVLGACLARAVDAVLAAEPLAARAAAARRLVVVPVPSGRRMTRRRGDRPVHALARSALAGLDPGEASLVDALTQVRAVADQAGLGADDRRANLTSAMAVPRSDQRRVSGSVCLVVDDVITSGSTVAEACRALRGAGAVHVVAASALVTARRDGPPANPYPARASATRLSS